MPPEALSLVHLPNDELEQLELLNAT